MKKAIALNKRQFARTTANLDGKGHGLSQKEAEEIFTKASNLDLAYRLAGYKSPLFAMHKKNVKRAKAFKAKKKK